MTSPESSDAGGLRRRGRGSISESAGGHGRQPSDGFGSFVDASSMPTLGSDQAGLSIDPASPSPVTFDSGLSESMDPSSAASVSTPVTIDTARPSDAPLAQGDDDWQTGDLVQDFSPVSERFPALAASRMTAKRTASSTSQGSQWADWDSFLASHDSQMPTTSTMAPAAASTDASHTGHFNPADDAFFDAFDQIAKQQQVHRAPSPPIIDLRQVERKLDLKRAASLNNNEQQGKHSEPKEDEDFFAAFERAPERALGRGSALRLEPSQLDDIHDARTSPMRLATDSQPDYFDTAVSGTAKAQPIEQPPTVEGQSQGRPSRIAASPPDSAASSSWTGSLRKTWTSFRGLSGDLVSHLPSASDFIVPPEEGEDAAPAAEQDTRSGGGGGTGGGGLFFAPSQLGERRASGASNGSGHRPSIEIRRSPLPSSASFGGPSADSSGPLRARDLFASLPAAHAPAQNTLRRAPSHSASMPIAGAPGFDASGSRKWNTGHWTLDAKQAKRAIPVTLTDRREETESVCEPWHAARIQAALPPRLQLGRQWRLLYSLDQHGMSLSTLYHRVAQGLDPSKARKVSSGVHEAEGWLRGASAATKAAMGVEGSVNGSGGTQQPRLKRVGGGLSIQDAGLVIAIKDDNDNVFGAYVNEKLRPQQHYYGSGECFLWKTVRRSKAEREAFAAAAKQKQLEGTSPAAEEEDEEDGAGAGGDASRALKTFRWTGKNDYMVLTESDFLSVGGGNGKFGLWVDGALERGVSTRCPAFDNEILCDGRAASGNEDEGEARFECIGLEIWAVGIDD